MNIVVQKRTVTAEDAIRRLKRIFANAKFKHEWDWIDAWFYVEVLRSYTAQEPWVPVTESLPDDPDRPFVQIVIDGVVQKFPAKYNFGFSEWEWADENFDHPPSDIVTHWRHLPARF